MRWLIFVEEYCRAGVVFVVIQLFIQFYVVLETVELLDTILSVSWSYPYIEHII